VICLVVMGDMHDVWREGKRSVVVEIHRGVVMSVWCYMVGGLWWRGQHGSQL